VAPRVAGGKRLSVGSGLIGRLEPDNSRPVRRLRRQSLHLNRGQEA